MISEGIVSIRRPIRRANCWVKWPHQPRDILGTLPQWRQQQREDVQPIVEIFPEAPVGDHFCQIAVCRCHQAYIDLDGPGTAQTFELLLLQDAQQLGLQFRGNVANLVEEQGPLMRQLKTAHL